MRIASFPPIVAPDAKVLILGTMPGAASLERQEYYAHKQNHFWKILFALFADGAVPTDFSQKAALIQKHNIALWDVLAHCTRQGSLDANIRDAVENDILGLLSENPNIKHLVFNGQQSHKFFLRKFGKIAGLSYHVMPSTSPAHTLAFEKKRAAWSLLRDWVLS